jgi:hypothetical protein
MSLIKTYLYSLQTNTMNEEQLSKIKDSYAEMILDNMDYKDMERLLFDVVRGDMDSATEEEIKDEIIDFYDIEKWEEMVSRPSKVSL